MKKTVSMIVYFLLFSLRSYAADFSEPRWGMSPDTVKLIRQLDDSAEIIPRLCGKEKLSYRGDILGRDALLHYDFCGGTLYRLRCFFNSVKYGTIADFEAIKQSLISRYGSPAADHPLETEAEKRGEILGYFAAWNTRRSKIYLILFAEEGRKRILLGCQDKNYLPESSEELVDLYSVLE